MPARTTELATTLKENQTSCKQVTDCISDGSRQRAAVGASGLLADVRGGMAVRRPALRRLIVTASVKLPAPRARTPCSGAETDSETARVELDDL